MAAFRHLLEHEAAIAAAVGNALVDYCPGEAHDGDEFTDVETVEDLRPIVALGSVHVLSVIREGIAYVGFGFACAWDQEHGAGVMTHLGRVVAVGQGPGADVVRGVDRAGRRRRSEDGPEMIVVTVGVLGGCDGPGIHRDRSGAAPPPIE